MRLETAVLAALITLGCETAPETLATSRDEINACPETPERQLLWGDLHVHTSWSFDANIAGTTADPSDAYAFAKGLDTVEIATEAGPRIPLHIGPPLQFTAVTDHSEFLAETQICTTPGMPGYTSSTCQTYRNNPTLAFALFGLRLTSQNPTRFTFCSQPGVDCSGVARTTWQRVQDAADDANDPCNFTALSAYEWTGTTSLDNFHRNVVFRGTQLPTQPTSYFEAPTPQDLWSRLFLDCQSGNRDCDVLAIPHNSNASGGNMFVPENPDGSPLSAAQANFRARMEPLVEIYQHKGDSECLPGIFAGEEECGFEKLGGIQQGAGYVRNALEEGLRQQRSIGANPFKLGIIASTDTHNASPGAVDENRWEGHLGNTESSPEQRLSNGAFSPGGLAAVWATSNTRDGVFDALARRETYGTSGPRIAVRMFGGWDYPDDLCNSATLVEDGYAGGVPMGADLTSRPSGNARPRIVVAATWDPGHDIAGVGDGYAPRDGTRLERIQIVKAWVDGFGITRERVYDIAGQVSNAQVDTNTCAPTPTGAEHLCAVWEDPTFNANAPAFYYARVLEEPSCRWDAFECIDAGISCGGSVPREYRYCCNGTDLTVQERAWTSPVWYTP